MRIGQQQLIEERIKDSKSFMTVDLDAPDLLVRFAIAVLRVVRRFVAAVELDVLGRDDSNAWRLSYECPVN